MERLLLNGMDWLRALQRSMAWVLVVVFAGTVGLQGCGGDESDYPALEEEQEKEEEEPIGALPGNPHGQLVVDIYKWLSSAYSYLTDRRTCSALIENYTQDTFKRIGQSKKSEDSWTNKPAETMPPWDRVWFHDGGLSYWTTKGGWLRGCWNNATYESPRGTVKVATSDPWSGSNSYSCEVKGVGGKPAPFRCIRNGSYFGRWGGNHLLATYCIVDDATGDNACNDR